MTCVYQACFKAPTRLGFVPPPLHTRQPLQLFANGIALHAHEQYLNIKLEQVSVVEPERFPQLVMVTARGEHHTRPPCSPAHFVWFTKLRSSLSRRALFEAAPFVMYTYPRSMWTLSCCKMLPARQLLQDHDMLVPLTFLVVGSSQVE